jgi:hypothetical protein
MAMILPILPEGRMASATLGPPVPATTVLGRELRQSLPPTLVEALDKIRDQIEVEILQPLLCAASVEQLAKSFETMFPTFRDYYVSTVLIMWGCLQEDPQRFSALTIRSFQESEQLIRSRGPHWIGQAASLNALQGLAAIIRIAKAATKLFDKGKPADLEPNASDAELWANSIIAYALAFSAALAGLTALASGRPTSVKMDNVATLAQWSRRYAVQAYHLTKAIGLLSTARPGAPIGQSEEDDLVLAEAGLDSYAESLAQDESASRIASMADREVRQRYHELVDKGLESQLATTERFELERIETRLDAEDRDPQIEVRERQWELERTQLLESIEDLLMRLRR